MPRSLRNGHRLADALALLRAGEPPPRRRGAARRQPPHARPPGASRRDPARRPRPPRGVPARHEAFAAVVTPLHAYVLGLLTADGCVHEPITVARHPLARGCARPTCTSASRCAQRRHVPGADRPTTPRRCVARGTRRCEWPCRAGASRTTSRGTASCRGRRGAPCTRTSSPCTSSGTGCAGSGTATAPRPIGPTAWRSSTSGSAARTPWSPTSARSSSHALRALAAPGARPKRHEHDLLADAVARAGRRATDRRVPVRRRRPVAPAQARRAARGARALAHGPRAAASLETWEGERSPPRVHGRGRVASAPWRSARAAWRRAPSPGRLCASCWYPVGVARR
jgi:hypothetical protein